MRMTVAFVVLIARRMTDDDGCVGGVDYKKNDIDDGGCVGGVDYKQNDIYDSGYVGGVDSKQNDNDDGQSLMKQRRRRR